MRSKLIFPKTADWVDNVQISVLSYSCPSNGLMCSKCIHVTRLFRTCVFRCRRVLWRDVYIVLYDQGRRLFKTHVVIRNGSGRSCCGVLESMRVAKLRDGVARAEVLRSCHQRIGALWQCIPLASEQCACGRKHSGFTFGGLLDQSDRVSLVRVRGGRSQWNFRCLFIGAEVDWNTPLTVSISRVSQALHICGGLVTAFYESWALLSDEISSMRTPCSH